MKPTLKMIHSATGFKAIELSEFLQADILGWPIETLFDKTIEGLPSGGELLIDGVVFPKENTSKMNAKMAYSSCQKGCYKVKNTLFWFGQKRLSPK